MPNRSRVSVAACLSYAPEQVEYALAELFEAMGGLASIIKPGQTVLLKPNLLSPHIPDDAVTTHPEVVRQLIFSCVRAGAARIWVGDSPAGEHAESALWAKTGMADAVAGTPAELKSWIVQQIPIACGSDVLAVPAWYAEVDVVVSLAKLKTHTLTTMTCALKNVYGLVSGQAKAQFHAKYPSPKGMSEFLVRVHAALTPAITIADAVLAMDGNGPARGRPRTVGVLMASRDAVALDTVACRALRIAATDVPMIRLATTKGLGTMVEAEIESVGSGLPLLQAARMKPSLAKYLGYVPEPFFNVITRLFRLRPGIQNARCTQCLICAGICPRQAIVRDPKTGYPVVRQDRCIACFCCIESCPQNAIDQQLFLGTLCRIAKKARRRET